MTVEQQRRDLSAMSSPPDEKALREKSKAWAASIIDFVCRESGRSPGRGRQGRAWEKPDRRRAIMSHDVCLFPVDCC